MKKILWLLLPALAIVLAFGKTNDVTITGKVTDAAGVAIPSVFVKWVSSKISTHTRPDGSFEITIPKLTGTLEFSAAGFENQRVQLTDKTVINVTLQASASELAEVVVTGHAKARKMMVSGNNTQALTGRAPGLQASAGYNTGNGYYYDQRRDKRAYDIDYPQNDEEYEGIVENSFLRPLEKPLSTFSIDVDAASYSNVRRMLNMGQKPPADAVRIEEMVNYFNYDYAGPTDEHPFAIHTEMSDAPWNRQHKLVMIGLQGKRIPTENLPASNLVFLIDVSGSMSSPNKLPLVQSSVKMLVDQLREQDRVSIVVYAGAAGVVLEPTTGNKKEKIKEAIDQLQSGGSTAGGAGIKLAYKLAREHFVKEGNNRVILCTDGDFNVGESSDAAMEKLIEKERESGVFLTVLGYGMGNYKDSKMQKLADKGNGNHAYIDGMSEARKVLVNEFGGTLFTIAKDVKLQIEFNPARVQAYRLIGYENRLLAAEDFNDDKKDAGELGSGHTVTALYEIVPVGVESTLLGSIDPLKYQKNKPATPVSNSNDWMTVKFRYKQPDGNKSRLLERVLTQDPVVLSKTSDNFRFAAAVAEMGLLLRDSKHKADASFAQVIQLAKAARGSDEQGYRAEFVRLVESAGSLAKN